MGNSIDQGLQLELGTYPQDMPPSLPQQEPDLWEQVLEASSQGCSRASPKERRGAKTDHKSKETECSLTGPAFQDGEYSVSEGPPKKRRLYDQAGLTGCVLDHPDSCERQKTLQIFVPRQSFSVPLSSTWIGNDPSGTQVGRHADFRLNSIRDQSPSQENSDTFRVFGLSRQLEEEYNRASSDNRVSGFSSRVEDFETQGTRIKGPEDTEGLSSPLKQKYGVREGLSPHNWATSFSESSSSSWSTALQSPSETEAPDSPRRLLSGRPQYVGRGSQERSFLLDF